MIKGLIALVLALLLAAPAIADEWDVDSTPKSGATENSDGSSPVAAKSGKGAVKAGPVPDKADITRAKADKASAKAAAKAEKVAAKKRAKQAKLDAKQARVTGEPDSERQHIGSYFGSGDEFVDSGAPEAATEAQQPAETAQAVDAEPAPADEAAAESVEPAAEPGEEVALSDEAVAETAPEAAPVADNPIEPVADAPTAPEAPPAPEAGLEHYSSYPAMKGRGKAKSKHRARQFDDSEDAPNLAETDTGNEQEPNGKAKSRHDDPSDW